MSQSTKRILAKIILILFYSGAAVIIGGSIIFALITNPAALIPVGIFIGFIGLVIIVFWANAQLYKK